MNSKVELMWNRIVWLLVLCLVAPVSAVGAAQAAPCPAESDLLPRLETGIWARVISGNANNLRADAGLGGTIIGKIPADDLFRVVDGPRCADGYVWWQVDYVGATGWTAEGSAANVDYWLEPLGSAELVSDDTAPADLAGCLKPPEVYDRVEIGYGILNLRTLAMLDHAQELYGEAGGVLTFRRAIMQGGYNPGGVAASFGTHDGGGALDISVRDPMNGVVMSDDIPLMIQALRTAGFAAWLRDTNELYAGSPIHIHAIAIGDAELSEAARGQIDGTFGYLRGYNGLPQDSGIPLPDTSGEMIICNWMSDLGFHDLRP